MISRHTQYYIIMQLVYGLRKIAAIECDNLRDRFEMKWIANVFIILPSLGFDFHSSRFILRKNLQISYNQTAVYII